MQAIITRYHGPTNTRSPRMSAECQALKIFVEYEHALSIERNHTEACRELITRLGWIEKTHGKFVGGELPSGDTVWVLTKDFAPTVSAEQVYLIETKSGRWFFGTTSERLFGRSFKTRESAEKFAAKVGMRDHVYIISTYSDGRVGR